MKACAQRISKGVVGVFPCLKFRFLDLSQVQMMMKMKILKIMQMNMKNYKHHSRMGYPKHLKDLSSRCLAVLRM